MVIPHARRKPEDVPCDGGTLNQEDLGNQCRAFTLKINVSTQLCAVIPNDLLLPLILK